MTLHRYTNNETETNQERLPCLHTFPAFAAP